MPLEPQTVAVPISSGLDTKTHDHVLEPGRATVLQNAVFTKDGVLQKRRGFTGLPSVIYSAFGGLPSSISAGKGLASFKDELCLFTGESLYTYSPYMGMWGNVGTAVSVIVDEKQVIRDSYEQSLADIAYANGLFGAVWASTEAAGVFVSVWDSATNAQLIAPIEITGGLGERPRIVGCGNDFFIFYGKGPNIYYTRIIAGSPVGAEVNVATSGFASVPPFEVYSDDENRIYFVYQDGGLGGSVRVAYIDRSDNFTTINTSAQYALGFGPAAGIDIHSVGSTIWAVWSDMTTGVRGLALNRELTSSSFNDYISNVVNVENVSVIAESGELNCSVYYSDNTSVLYKSVVSSGVAATEVELKRGVTLDGDAFVYGNKHYMPVIHASDLQSTYFMLDEDGVAVAKAIQSTSGDARAQLLSSVVEVSTGVFVTINQKKHRLETESGVINAITGLSTIQWDFTKVENFSALEAGDNLLILGSILHMYDGSTIVEHGFNVFPEGCAVSNTGAGSVDIGTHGYAFIYEWTDKQGNIHRSAPEYKTLVIAGSAASVGITFTTLHLTRKENVRLVAYRTAANGSVYYRLTDMSTPVLNDTTVDSVSFADNAADSTITSNEVLYSTGAVLEHIAPPPAYAICTYRGRTILADKNTVYYSKVTFPGEPVAFNDAASIAVDPGRGDITAVATNGDKLLIFRSGSIFETYGDGPTDTGVGADYPDPRLISLDVGAESQNSVVNTPVGTMFKSSKGIYVVGSGGEVQYIGAQVEDYNDQTVISAKLVPDTNQVRFICSDGDAIVYDYQAGKWATFTKYAAVAATTWQNQFCLLQSNGTVLVEDNSFRHNGSFYPLKYTSGWISFNGLLNFSRVWRMMCLGEFKTNHKYKVSFAYDHIPVFVDSVVVDAAAIAGVTKFGEDSPYGSGSPYGGNYAIDKFNIHLKRQKCSSIMFSIEDVQTGTTIGESYNITGVVFQVGAKRGLDKLKANRKAGSS